MVLSAEDKAEVGTLVTDAMTAAATKFSEQAAAAASEAINAVAAKVDQVTATVAKLAEAGAGPAAKGKPAEGDEAPVTVKALAELMARRDAEDAERRKKAEADGAAVAARETYLAEKCKDLPAVYRQQIPATADAKVLAAAEQAARTAYRDDLAKAGFKAPDLGAAPGKGATPLSAADAGRLTGVQKIAAALAADGGR